MLTPDDELARVDEELGRLYSWLHACQRSLFDGRMTDPKERAANEKRLRLRIDELEYHRAGIYADQIAHADHYDFET